MYKNKSVIRISTLLSKLGCHPRHPVRLWIFNVAHNKAWDRCKNTCFHKQNIS